MNNVENNEVLEGNSPQNEENPIEIKTFTSDSFGSLRTTFDQYGRPVICLKDACNILGLKNPSDQRKRLRAEGVIRIAKVENGKFNNYLYITEGNLYRLIFQSRKEEAVQFTDWVTEVVLPSIRKFGRYDVRQITSNPEVALSFLDSYNELRVRNNILESINEESIETREYFRQATDSGVLRNLKDVPAILKIKGINKQSLFSLLRSNGVLDETNNPTQEYIDKGWFRVDTHSYINKNATTVTHVIPMVYKTGINGIRRLIEKWAGKK
ncbi:MAG: phage antirepressor KilAC domain-containing protein [Bacilli bacterium]|nr:phage antirepressor KilAC domain-containing protein [Bacilli bacterium]